MITLSNEERSKLFRTAQEQLDTRIHNSKGSSTDSLIELTFKKLDIEALCPNYIKAKKELAKEFAEDSLSPDVTKRMKARETVKKNRDIETWTVNDNAGTNVELNNLSKEFKKVKRSV